MAQLPPLLPDHYASAFVTYWLPMDGSKFVSSGNVWFDYGAACFRIDGLFNPWDVEARKSHLWMSELSHYGAGVSYQISLLYDRVRRDAGTLSIESQSLLVKEVPVHEAIFPQNYLQEVGAVRTAAARVLGVDVDEWTLPAGNRLGIRRVYLRSHSNELVRMEQCKREDVVVRDFPNLVTHPIDRSVFSPQNLAFARRQ
jgi:violacein biosynthesis protein VioE